MSIDQKCERCRTKEDIPTHQFLKFENDLHYVDLACWELSKDWYFKGVRATGSTGQSHSPRSVRGLSDCDRCHTEEYIPAHQSLKFGDEIDKVRYLCQACFELFKGWYYRGARALSRGEDMPK